MLALLTNKYVIGGIAAALILGFVAYKIEDYGYSRGLLKLEQFKTELAVKSIAEIERQDAANNKAKIEEAKWIAEIEKQDAQLNKLREELAREADKDTNANSIAHTTSSVMRINRVH
jgi:methionyl-tRNA formyltransferase